MEPGRIVLLLNLITIVSALGSIGFAACGRAWPALASITLALATVSGSVYVIKTDDTPTWRDRMEATYGVEIDEAPPRDKDRPGDWKIDGEWRTCYSPDYYEAEDDETLLCQPVSPDTAFVELSK